MICVCVFLNEYTLWYIISFKTSSIVTGMEINKKSFYTVRFIKKIKNIRLLSLSYYTSFVILRSDAKNPQDAHS